MYHYRLHPYKYFSPKYFFLMCTYSEECDFSIGWKYMANPVRAAANRPLRPSGPKQQCPRGSQRRCDLDAAWCSSLNDTSFSDSYHAVSAFSDLQLQAGQMSLLYNIGCCLYDVTRGNHSFWIIACQLTGYKIHKPQAIFEYSKGQKQHSQTNSFFMCNRFDLIILLKKEIFSYYLPEH